MDPIQMLIEDHRQVDQLFEQFEQTSSPQEREQIAQRVFKALAIHGILEKQIFYPAVAKKGDVDDKELVDHSYHDHAEVEQLIGQLKAMAPTDSDYESTFMELKQHVQEHANEEEEDMFPDAQQHLEGELTQLGAKMQQLKQELMAVPL